MSERDLPSLAQDFDLPAEQKVTSGVASDYIGVYAQDPQNPWIVVQITRPERGFPRVERWFPLFECSLPDGLSRPHQIDGPVRYFQFWFSGIPSERGRFGP